MNGQIETEIMFVVVIILGMEFENNDDVSEMNIPKEILKIIEERIAVDIAIYSEEDIWTAEQDEEYELDYKISEYLLLVWLKSTLASDSVLYAGSGSDVLPKCVFGENVVVHTSMENYESNEAKYFPELGQGIKVTADNVNLPLPNSYFDIVMHLGLFTSTSILQLNESDRVLKRGGLVVCDNTITDNVNLPEIFPDYKVIDVPKYIQNRGISETYFTVLKKE